MVTRVECYFFSYSAGTTFRKFHKMAGLILKQLFSHDEGVGNAILHLLLLLHHNCVNERESKCQEKRNNFTVGGGSKQDILALLVFVCVCKKSLQFLQCTTKAWFPTSDLLQPKPREVHSQNTAGFRQT